MPSIFTHAIVPLAIRLAAGKARIGDRLMLAGMIASILPDADVLAFALRIPYADAFGHRGASHSLLFALAVAAAGALAARPLQSRASAAGLLLFVSALSHPLLDALTSGGLGVALAWPWTDTHWFAPWRPIRVSPIGASFFSARGAEIWWSELRWVWLPLLVAALSWRAIAGLRPMPQAK
ncbi:MAG: metal-dependent hydrolase [Pseudoxanthomonas sp.]